MSRVCVCVCVVSIKRMFRSPKTGIMEGFEMSEMSDVGFEPVSSARSVSAFNHRAVSLAPAFRF